jgi:soluble lytic murein transglycosylase-like protein
MEKGKQRLRIPVGALAVSVALLMGAGTAVAEIYKYIDDRGNLHYTDKPQSKSRGFELLWRSGDDPRFASYSRIDFSALERNKLKYSQLIVDAAKRASLQPELIHAIVRAESAYDPNALSKKGARGLMQLMPGTADRYGVRDSWNPAQNLQGGARYLRDLLDMFDQNLKLAVAAYNAGENAVRKYGNKIPPYPETQHYVRKVVAFYQGES